MEIPPKWGGGGGFKGPWIGGDPDRLTHISLFALRWAFPINVTLHLVPKTVCGESTN